jgi:3D (Asp-Asp-Asp) domain-containing protein
MAIGDRMPVTVTMYSSESPETGTITASGQKVRRGIIAVSRDLEHVHGLKFGDKVELEGIGTFEVQDRMNVRWTMRVDIWVPTVKEALNFGKQEKILIVLGPEGKPSSGGA